MKLRAATLLPIAFFLVFAGVVALPMMMNLFGRGFDPKVLPSMLINKPLPAFALDPLDPAQPGLKSAELKGKGITLVNVFGSWCVSCRYEHPLLMQLAKDKRFTLVGIDWKDTPENATKYLNEFGNPYALVGTDQVGRTAIDLGVSGAPETFVVDDQGLVRLRIPGPLTPEIWTKDVEPLLKDAGKAS